MFERVFSGDWINFSVLSTLNERQFPLIKRFHWRRANRFVNNCYRVLTITCVSSKPSIGVISKFSHKTLLHVTAITSSRCRRKKLFNILVLSPLNHRTPSASFHRPNSGCQQITRNKRVCDSKLWNCRRLTWNDVRSQSVPIQRILLFILVSNYSIGCRRIHECEPPGQYIKLYSTHSRAKPLLWRHQHVSRATTLVIFAMRNISLPSGFRSILGT